MIGPKGERIHKSHVKVAAAQHEAAMKKGAREIKPGAVIYKQGGKLYMLKNPRMKLSMTCRSSSPGVIDPGLLTPSQ
jgi:hypothetical protein